MRSCVASCEDLLDKAVTLLMIRPSGFPDGVLDLMSSVRKMHVGLGFGRGDVDNLMYVLRGPVFPAHLFIECLLLLQLLHVQCPVGCHAPWVDCTFVDVCFSPWFRQQCSVRLPATIMAWLRPFDLGRDEGRHMNRILL